MRGFAIVVAGILLLTFLGRYFNRREDLDAGWTYDLLTGTLIVGVCIIGGIAILALSIFIERALG